MSSEVSSYKLPNLNDSEIEWLEVALALFKPRVVYLSFVDNFPRLHKLALENGISEDDFRHQLLVRFRDMVKNKRRGSYEVIQKISRVNMSIFRSKSVINYFYPPERAESIRIRMNELPKRIEHIPLLGEDDTMLKALKLEHEYAKYLKTLQNVEKNTDPTSKTLPTRTQEDTTRVQAKEQSLPTGEIDWDDDSWLAGGDEEDDAPEE
ncbi:hypothetical protein J5I95_22600 [Candidatus Poribacteria bacterium]|nr:hypothetical protein [Candidatus Poribacteria bacterium]